MKNNKKIKTVDTKKKFVKAEIIDGYQKLKLN